MTLRRATRRAGALWRLTALPTEPASAQSGAVADDRHTAYGFGPLRRLQGLASNAAEHRRVEIRCAQ